METTTKIEEPFVSGESRCLRTCAVNSLAGSNDLIGGEVRRLLAVRVEIFRCDVRNLEDDDRAGFCDVIVDASAEPPDQAGVAWNPGYVVRSSLIGSISRLEPAKRRGPTSQNLRVPPGGRRPGSRERLSRGHADGSPSIVRC